MNIRADSLHFSTRARPGAPDCATFRNPAGAARRTQAAVVPLAGEVTAVVFDEKARPEGAPRRRRIEARLEGAPVGRPFLATELELVSGGLRHVLMLGRRAEEIAASRMEITIDGAPTAGLDPEWLQSPVADSSALIDGLAEAGRRRLLRLILTTGASLFGFSDETGYGAVTRELLALQGGLRQALGSVCPVGGAGVVLSYRLPKESGRAEFRTLVLETRDRIVNIKGFETCVEETPRGYLLHLFCPGRLPDGAELVALADTPLVLEGPGAGHEAQSLVPWMERRDAHAAAWLEGLVAAWADRDAGAAAIARELGASGEAGPLIALQHLSATSQGLLHAFELRDGLGLVRALRVDCGGESREIDLAGDAAVPGLRGGYLPGFSAAGAPAASWRLRLVYRSGRVHTIHEGPVPRFDGAVPECFSRLGREVAAESIALARLDGAEAPARSIVERFGASTVRPRLSIVAPASASGDILRARAARIFGERQAGQVELVHHVREGAEAEAARKRLAEIHRTYGIAIKLVTLIGAPGPAAALCAGLEAAEGELTLVLGAEVMPANRGWLADWLRCFQAGARKAAVLGGTLCATDGSVLDAGGLVEDRGALRRRPVGIPATDLPGGATAATGLATCDCAGFTAEAKAAFLASRRSHPDPDIRLAETIGRLEARGNAARTSFRNLFIRYSAPGAADPISAAADRIAIGVVARAGEGPETARGKA
ncbi:MAG: glycosyltransferase family 2 protein [Rhodobacteraceae bacterium]|nr:glycosyltransferase family 2 protein [Paracoccaceae bacterium]